MTREEVIKALNEIKECPIGLKAWYIVALEMAISALEQEPCEDAISREAVMGLVAREHSEWDDLYIDIAKLPSVIPSRQVIENIKAEIEEVKEKMFCTDDEKQGLDVALSIIDKHIEGR